MKCDPVDILLGINKVIFSLALSTNFCFFASPIVCASMERGNISASADNRRWMRRYFNWFYWHIISQVVYSRILIKLDRLFSVSSYFLLTPLSHIDLRFRLFKSLVCTLMHAILLQNLNKSFNSLKFFGVKRWTITKYRWRIVGYVTL